MSAACDDCGGEYEDDDYPGGLHWDSTAATRPPCATCRRCGSSYASDRTPMSNRGYCMMCRPHIDVTCQRCGAPCPGAFDGQEKCAECRAERLGVQQHEDKQGDPRGDRLGDHAGVVLDRLADHFGCGCPTRYLPRCPRCRASLRLRDIHVPTPTGYCRRCSRPSTRQPTAAPPRLARTAPPEPGDLLDLMEVA